MAGLLAVALAQLAATIVVAHVLHTGGTQSVWLAATAALCAFACEAWLRRLSEGLGLDYVTATRDKLFRHLMAVRPATVMNRRHGAMLQSFVGDLTALRQWVSEGIMRSIVAAIALAGLLGWLAFTRPALGVLAVGIVAACCLAGLALAPALAATVREVRRERGRVSAFASQRLAASSTVQACGRSGTEAARLARRVDRLNRASLQRAWLTGILRALPHLAATGIVIGAVLMNGAQGTGGMAGLVLVIGIIGLALRDLARAAELAVPGMISLKRIEAILALPRTAYPDRKARVSRERGLVLQGLALRSDAAPLDGHAATGEVVLIDGDPQLIGTLFRTLAGVESPLAGSMRWNGSDLASRRPSRRREFVGLASADLPLLAGSALFNLRYRAPSVSDGDLAALAAEWDVDTSSHDIPPGRLSLLRAMAGQPPMLLLAPDDHGLEASDIARLSDVLASWPGVVLLASHHPLLSACATRHWNLDRDGLREMPPIPALTHIMKEQAA